MANDKYTDQTKFMSEEPIFEDVSMPDAPDVKAGSETGPDTPEKAPKNNRRKLIIVGVVGLILIIVFILLLVLFRMNGDVSSPEPSESPVPQQSEQEGENALYREVLDLQAQLEKADPASNTLPFPPVDMNIRLDPAPRR